MKNTTDKILVVIPYLAKAAQGSELLLAITGWRKHFKENFVIVVVGDWHPVCDSKDVIFINCPRVKWPGKGNYWAHIDHVNKFKAVRKEFPESKGFVYTCDDIYATRDFTMQDVLYPKVRCREINGSFHHGNAWVRENYRTRKILENDGLPAMNWVCHLPLWYEWDKLFAIYDKYKCETHSRVVEQLYFNTYYADSKYIVIEEEENDYQFKLWRKEQDIEELKQAIGKKYWICNSAAGYTEILEELLREHYDL